MWLLVSVSQCEKIHELSEQGRVFKQNESVQESDGVKSEPSFVSYRERLQVGYIS